MNIVFEDASSKGSYLRCALVGPSGSGKTWTALTIASQFGVPFVIDTERSSALKYAKHFKFKHANIPGDFNPRNYIAACHAAIAAGAKVLVVDSLSHAWEGVGGVLEFVDNVAKRQKTANSFQAWREGTPLQNELVDGLLALKCHLVCTMRSKMEYAQQTDGGKTRVVKLGMGAIQRNGIEYEFDVVLEMDLEHDCTVGKTRFPELSGQVFRKPDEKFSKKLFDIVGGADPNPVAFTSPQTNGKYENSSKSDLEMRYEEICKEAATYGIETTPFVIMGNEKSIKEEGARLRVQILSSEYLQLCDLAIAQSVPYRELLSDDDKTAPRLRKMITDLREELGIEGAHEVPEKA
jgi:hypothetical protein